MVLMVVRGVGVAVVVARVCARARRAVIFVLPPGEFSLKFLHDDFIVFFLLFLPPSPSHFLRRRCIGHHAVSMFGRVR